SFKPRSSRIESAPDARQPWLLFAWRAVRAVIMRQLNESGRGHVAAPRLEIVKHTVAPATPAFLVVAARVRAEQHATRFQSRVQFEQYARQFLPRDVKQRGVGEHAIEMLLRQ